MSAGTGSSVDPAKVALVLYQRDDCELCDRALIELARAGVADFDSVFIDGDGALEIRFGSRVPVLRRHDGAELAWPFDAAAVSAFRVV